MKRKLYIMFFTVEGFEQLGKDSDGDDLDPDLDNMEKADEDNNEDMSNKDKSQGEDMGEPIDELDKANFPPKNTLAASSSQSNSQRAASAVEFHPPNMLDTIHEDFVEEIRSKTPEKNKEADNEKPTLQNPFLLKDLIPCQFEMVETDEEEEELVDEMHCLPKDLALAMGSVKRFLLETLDSVESVQKKKPSVKNSPVWGRVLTSKPITRNHGDIKIMDKAVAYMKRKNLEIPNTFKAASLWSLWRLRNKFCFQGQKWRNMNCILAKLSYYLHQWKVLCDDAQATLLQRCILLLDKRHGELMRIAWK
ncbi:hypothetical protein VPH35_002883 [Triticum aestivum]